MKTLLINVDDSSSAKLFLDLAKKLHFTARIVSAEEKEDTALLKMMEERKDDENTSLKSTYKIFEKLK